MDAALTKLRTQIGRWSVSDDGPEGAEDRSPEQWLKRNFAELSQLRNTDKRRGGRVVECTGLENRHAFAGIVGSNPTLSAITQVPFLGTCVMVKLGG